VKTSILLSLILIGCTTVKYTDPPTTTVDTTTTLPPATVPPVTAVPATIPPATALQDDPARSDGVLTKAEYVEALDSMQEQFPGFYMDTSTAASLANANQLAAVFCDAAKAAVVPDDFFATMVDLSGQQSLLGVEQFTALSVALMFRTCFIDMQKVIA
jgi:multidrug efflux pump subunit AcrA (membrane-fusion protein)